MLRRLVADADSSHFGSCRTTRERNAFAPTQSPPRQDGGSRSIYISAAKRGVNELTHHTIDNFKFGPRYQGAARGKDNARLGGAGLLRPR
jgi:hypothetical protein